jgi:hypothetical protein
VIKKLADIATAYATGERGMGKYTGRRLSPTHDEIAQLAFSLYESRGRQDGHHIEDWLRAEQELVRHYAQLRRTDQYTRRIEMASVQRKVNL